MHTENVSPLAIISRFQNEPPVNVSLLSDALGLVVIPRLLSKTISGILQRDPLRGGTSGFVVYLNANEPALRQRFSLAHEVAHFVLHRDLIEKTVTDDTMYRSPELSSYYETQANRLAADILMPIRLVKNAMDTIRSLTELAKIFEVSRGSMEVRLKGLDIPYTS